MERNRGEKPKIMSTWPNSRTPLHTKPDASRTNGTLSQIIKGFFFKETFKTVQALLASSPDFDGSITRPNAHT